MKSYQSEVYNKRIRRYETVLVSWTYSPINNKAEITEIRGKSGDIKNHIPSYQFDNLMAEINRQACKMTFEERTSIMNSILKRSYENTRKNSNTLMA